MEGGQFGFEELGGHGAERGWHMGLNSGLRGDSACGGQGSGDQSSSEWLQREDGGEPPGMS